MGYQQIADDFLIASEKMQRWIDYFSTGSEYNFVNGEWQNTDHDHEGFAIKLSNDLECDLALTAIHRAEALIINSGIHDHNAVSLEWGPSFRIYGTTWHSVAYTVLQNILESFIYKIAEKDEIDHHDCFQILLRGRLQNRS